MDDQSRTTPLLLTPKPAHRGATWVARTDPGTGPPRAERSHLCKHQTLDMFLAGGGRPHSGLRRENMAQSKRLSVTFSVGNPLCPYEISYRRVQDSSLPGCSRSLRVVSCVVGGMREESRLGRRKGGWNAGMDNSSNTRYLSRRIRHLYRVDALKGYLAHEKPHRPRTL